MTPKGDQPILTGGRANTGRGLLKGEECFPDARKVPQPDFALAEECPLYPKAVIRPRSDRCPLCAKSEHSAN